MSIFVEWVDEINYLDAKPKYFFSDSDMFLTFNYTPVLEGIYGIKPENICHIHGSLNDQLCIVGHCNNDRKFDEYDDVVAFQLEQIHKQLIKPTSELYHNNISFFKKLYKLDVSEIVFFGFSFNEVDNYYIKNIFDNISTLNIKAYLSPYEDSHKREEDVNEMRVLGFKGTYAGKFN